MAKKRRRSRRGGGRRHRSGGGGLFSLSKRDTQAALAAAGGYTYLATMAAEKPADYAWFTKLPVVQSVGRAATVALIAGLAYKQGIAKKYTKPIAIGVGCVALANMARRKFKLYEGTDGATALAGEYGDELSGDVDLEYEAA